METKTTTPVPAEAYSRRAYRPEDLNTVLEFARDHGLPPHQTQAGFRHILQNLISSGDQVIQIVLGEQLVAVGAVLDRVMNLAKTTPFELFGLDLKRADSAYQALLTAADKQLPKGSAGLTVFHHFMHPFGDELLLNRGYRPYLNTYAMILRLPESSGAPLPAGVRMEPLKLENFDFYFELLRETYGQNLDAVLPSKQDLLKETMSRTVPPVLLFEGSKLIGFVTIQRDAKDSSIGRIGAIGVLKSHRKRGFGKVLLRQAIDALVSEKVKRIALDATAATPEAMKIYEDLGFQVIDRFAGFIRPAT